MLRLARPARVLLRAAVAHGRLPVRAYSVRVTAVRATPTLAVHYAHYMPTGSKRFYASDAFPAHQKVEMPALSPTMTQGNIGTWQKKVGDAIAPGDVLVEIETDKAQMDFECQEEGYLAKVLVDSGAKDVKVGTLIAIMVEDEADVEKFANFSIDDVKGSSGAKAAVTGEEGQVPSEGEAGKESATKEANAENKGQKPTKAPEAQRSRSPGPATSGGSGDRIMASPMAQKLANEMGIDIGEVTGTGPGGRVTKSDVENYKPSAKAAPSAAAPAPSKAAPAAAAPSANYTDIPVSNMRKVIAQRLLESKQTVPHYYLTMEVEMDKINKLREVLNSEGEGKYKLSVNDFVIKAAALALKAHPEANSSWQGDVIRQYNTADISIAVATPTGLITPIVTSAETKGLSTISNSVKDLATRARAGKLQPQEYQGGSFSISNLGMYGITQFSAIINPPQGAILAVGGTEKKLIPDETKENGMRVANVMQVSLSADHRVIDGAVGATWLKSFKGFMENPLKMLL